MTTKPKAKTIKPIQTMDAFKKAYPNVTSETTVDLSPEARKAARRIVKLHAMIANLTKQEDGLKVLIALEIKGHCCGDAGDYNVYMPTVLTEKFDMDALQEADEELHDDLLAKYTTIRKTRKFDLRVKAGA